jgi:hypothetical protein
MNGSIGVTHNSDLEQSAYSWPSTRKILQVSDIETPFLDRQAKPGKNFSGQIIDPDFFFDFRS